MNQLLILTSSTKFELNSLIKQWNYNEITITDVFGCRNTVKIRNDVISKQWL